MSLRLLSLRGVPEDELAAIGQVLDAAGIEWFESPPGLFGLSPPALWLVQAQQAERARVLLAQFHAQRAEAARAEYEHARAAGQVPGLLASMWSRPWASLGLLILVLAVMFVLSLPFLWIGR